MIDIDKLKKELVEIYSNYLKDKESSQFKREALDFYRKYSGLAVVLDKKTAAALNSLIDIGADTGLILDDSRINEFLKHLSEV